MRVSRQEYWSGLPFPPPGNLPNPGIEPGSPALQADALPSELPGKPQKMSIIPPFFDALPQKTILPNIKMWPLSNPLYQELILD